MSVSSDAQRLCLRAVGEPKVRAPIFAAPTLQSGITVDRRVRLSLQIAAQFAGAECALAHSSVK